MNRPFIILAVIVTLLYTVTAIELSGGWLDELEPKEFNEFDVDQHLHDVIANNAERMLRRPGLPKTCRDGKRCKKKSDCKK
jgi:hypothetical protein